MNKLYIKKIDAVRGLAILLVLSFHMLSCIYPYFSIWNYSKNGILIIENTKSFILNFNPIGQGWIGVVLFLVVSGFLIHFIYLQNSSTYKWQEFFSKRFWRIYPLYFLVLLFFTLNQLEFTTQGLNNLLSHIFLVHNSNDNTFFSINPSFWTIALESQLYLMYPLLIKSIIKLNISKTILVLFILNIIIGVVQYFIDTNSYAFGTFFFLKYWFVWSIGAYLADKYFHKKRIFNKPFLSFLGFYLLFFIFKIFLFTNYFILIPGTFACLAFIEFILYTNFSNKFTISKTIKKFLTFTGLCSYSIYLIHQPYLDNLYKFYIIDTTYQYFNIFISVIFTYGTIFLISYSLYKLFELPSISHGQNLRKKGRLFF